MIQKSNEPLVAFLFEVWYNISVVKRVRLLEKEGEESRDSQSALSRQS